MRKVWQKTLLVLGLLMAVLPGRVGAKGSGLKEYVGEGPVSTRQHQEYIVLDVKDKPLRDVLREISRLVGKNIVADPGVEEKVTVTLDRVQWRRALEHIARLTNCRVVHESQRLIRLTQPPTISMEFQDADLKIVLDLLAKQSGANIIVSEEVKGKVTLSLREVPWMDALHTIVKTAGYTIVEDRLPSTGGLILRVVTPESLQKQLETAFIQLKYVRPGTPYEAAIGDIEGHAMSSNLTKDGKIVQPKIPKEEKEFTLYTALKQILSEYGSIQYDPVTNSFYVKDVKPRIDEIKKIVERVDRKPPQVHVKVKFVVSETKDLLETGIRFVDTETGERRGLNATAYGAQPDSSASNDLLYWGGKFPFDFQAPLHPRSAFHALGILDFTQTKLMMEYLEDDDASRIVQSPELTTLDSSPATIFVGENIPFAEQEVSFDQNGNREVTITENDRSPINIGFTLYLTPHVIPETEEIELCVIPKISDLSGKSSPLTGFERFAVGETYIDLPRVSSETVVTNMRVHDGHTCLIGGLQTEEKEEIRTRVPVLSSIPILGNIFTYHKEQKTDKSVLIMITPSILRDADMAERISQEALTRAQEVDYFHQKAKKAGEKK